MKLIHMIPLFIVAVLIVFSDPYGFAELAPQGKKDKNGLQDTLETNRSGNGPELQVEFVKGKAHNHPLLTVWVEDLSGNYLQTLYVSKSIATSIFNYGDHSDGVWTEGVVRRPAALPYWSHKRGIKAEDGLYLPTPENPVPDAYSGATPQDNFVLNTRLDDVITDAFYVLLEVNQPWDWNKFWTNNKYPDDEDYKSSSQPSVIYRARINPQQKGERVSMEVVGYGHYSGDDGSLTEDLSTLTTALDIAEKITVYLKPVK
jgi:hypothetical protein